MFPGIPLNLYGFVYSDSPTRSNSMSGYVIVDANILKAYVRSPGSARCSPVPMFPSPFVPCFMILAPMFPMFPSPYLPKKCSPVPMFPSPYVPQSLCTPGNIILTVETKGLWSRGTGKHRDWEISLGNIGTGNTLGEHRDWEAKGLGNTGTG